MPRPRWQLSRELLPDQVRVLGPDHPDTLATRAQHRLLDRPVRGCRGRAGSCSGSCSPTRCGCWAPTTPTPCPPATTSRTGPASAGMPAAALRLFRELLPDQVRVLGPDHPDVLTTRNNIAAWTSQCGDAAGALRLFRELLPDRGAGARP